MLYSKSDLDLIRTKIDMLSFLEERGLTFRQSGSTWLALCPIHSERSPSFNVKPDTQTFRCFGCGQSGDMFALLQAMDGLSFPGAVQELAETAGITLKIEEDPNFKHRQRLLQMTSLASQWYRKHYLDLELNHPAKQNLALRNLYEYSITDPSIGYAPKSGLVELLTSRGFTVDEIVQAGLVKISERDGNPMELFRNRLIWTIFNIQGKPIGFSARKIFDNDTGPKYINSPQTDLYNKSQVLLGLHDAKKTIAQEQVVYVVEGQADVMSMKAAGRQNTVASCGTAFGIEHTNMLLRLSKLGKASEKFKIVFCFDGDPAGVKAAQGVFEKNKNIHLNSYVVKFVNPDYTATDPCDYRKDFGDDKLNSLLLEKQVNIVEFILQEELKRWDVATPEGQSSFINQARDILSLITDPIQHSSYLRKVSLWTGVSYNDLTNRLRPKRLSNTPASTNTENDETSELSEIAQAEQQVLAAIIQYPKEMKQLLNKYNITVEYFANNIELAQIVINNATSGESFDYSNSNISKLSHMEIMIRPTREEYGLNLLIKSFLKLLHAQEIFQLNVNMATLSNNTESGVTASEIFMKQLEEQDRIKRKYFI